MLIKNREIITPSGYYLNRILILPSRVVLRIKDNVCTESIKSRRLEMDWFLITIIIIIVNLSLRLVEASIYFFLLEKSGTKNILGDLAMETQ